MVPASITPRDALREPPLVRSVMTRGVRTILVLIALAIAGLFWVAVTIDPYDAGGQPLKMGTHQQLGLPACNFVRLTGVPCPSCGMTTSFALLAHGDPVASLRANAVGTLLALFLAGLIPWNLLSAARGRWLWVRTIEPWLLGAVIGFIGLALVRWCVVVAAIWWG